MCITPSYIYVERGPTWERQPVPCKKCWSCRTNRVSDYVGRGLAEASVSDWTVALTLTYAPRDDLADKVLTPKHFQDFIRSIRKRGHRVRYLACGEYGDLKARAHFHCILFGKGQRPQIPQKKNCHVASWPHGHVFADWDQDEKALRYVCKYLLKNEAGKYWFSLSKKPPLGAEWFQAKAERHVELGVLPRSFDYLPPGGDRRRPYLMTRVTRRDFIAAVYDLWIKHRPFDRAKLSEWVCHALEQLEGHRQRQYVDAAEPAEVLAALADDVERKRPKDRTVLSKLMETEFQLTTGG